jgi:hypothetical protein
MISVILTGDYTYSSVPTAERGSFGSPPRRAPSIVKVAWNGVCAIAKLLWAAPARSACKT